MSVLKSAGVMIIVFLVVSQTSVLAQESAAEVSFGESLVRELWSDFKMGNMSALEKKMAPDFQSVHEDGARGREEELRLLQELNLGEYTLSDLKVTQVGPVIIVSYFVSTEETIEAKRLSTSPAARLSVFLETDSGWQWIAHANLNPLK